MKIVDDREYLGSYKIGMVKIYPFIAETAEVDEDAYIGITSEGRIHVSICTIRGWELDTAIEFQMGMSLAIQLAAETGWDSDHA